MSLPQVHRGKFLGWVCMVLVNDERRLWRDLGLVDLDGGWWGWWFWRKNSHLIFIGAPTLETRHVKCWHTMIRNWYFACWHRGWGTSKKLPDEWDTILTGWWISKINIRKVGVAYLTAEASNSVSKDGVNQEHGELDIWFFKTCRLLTLICSLVFVKDFGVMYSRCTSGLLCQK